MSRLRNFFAFFLFFIHISIVLPNDQKYYFWFDGKKCDNILFDKTFQTKEELGGHLKSLVSSGDNSLQLHRDGNASYFHVTGCTDFTDKNNEEIADTFLQFVFHKQSSHLKFSAQHCVANIGKFAFISVVEINLTMGFVSRVDRNEKCKFGKKKFSVVFSKLIDLQDKLAFLCVEAEKQQAEGVQAPSPEAPNVNVFEQEKQAGGARERKDAPEKPQEQDQNPEQGSEEPQKDQDHIKNKFPESGPSEDSPDKTLNDHTNDKKSAWVDKVVGSGILAGVAVLAVGPKKIKEHCKNLQSWMRNKVSGAKTDRLKIEKSDQ